MVNLFRLSMLSVTVPPVTQMEILIFSNKTLWIFIFQNLYWLPWGKVEICLGPQFLGHLPVCDGLKLQDSYIPIGSVKFQLSRMLGKSHILVKNSLGSPCWGPVTCQHLRTSCSSSVIFNHLSSVHHHLSFLKIINLYFVGVFFILKDSERHFYVRTSVWKCRFVCQNKAFWLL